MAGRLEMEIFIKDHVVCGGKLVNIPSHLSFGKYVIDKLKQCYQKEDRECLFNGITGQSETYKTLLQDTVNFAMGLKAMNIKRGDVIAVWSNNSPDILTAIIGILCAGASVTAFNILYTRDEITHALSISQPKIVIGSEELLKKAIDIFKSSLSIVKIIQFDGTPLDCDIISYKDVMVDTDIWSYEPTEIHGQSDLAFISYSSGTTGLPKGVMLTHLNVLYGVTIISGSESSENAKVISVLPWAHVYGLLPTIESLISQKTVVYLSKYKLDTFLKVIQEFKINEIIAVPPIIKHLAKSDITEKFDLSSVSTVWSACATLGAETIDEVMKCLPNCKGIFQGYGMTEIVVTVLKEDENNTRRQKLGSCGPPLPGIKAKVVDTDTREKLGVNEEGEICIKSPTIMKGYSGNAAATRDIIDEEGYLKTGDIGYYDSNGCFFIVDRIKDLIKYKGYQVAPASIEIILLQHNSIEDCGVVGTPDELAGELPTAFVVPKDGYSLTEEEVLHFTNERLSPIMRLRGGIIFVNKIPKNTSGKILRKELRRMLQELRK